MIETLEEFELPIGEKYRLIRNRLTSSSEINSPGRLSIVSGTHGDELEGQYVCYELARRINESPECLMGIVDIYPALNPFGIDMASKVNPLYRRDMNRTFPGDEKGTLVDRMAHAVIDNSLGSDICGDVHASGIGVGEIGP